MHYITLKGRWAIKTVLMNNPNCTLQLYRGKCYIYKELKIQIAAVSPPRIPQNVYGE